MTLILPRATSKLASHHLPLLRVLRPGRVRVVLARGSEWVWMDGRKREEVRGWLEGVEGWEGVGVEIEGDGNEVDGDGVEEGRGREMEMSW